ncbi:hypothetical protein [Nocardiopsis valliformis]|uniref:hypothetical protein n=1 Tax=Nocardiopsis valliformis TaxID=239974 RepID=UPI00037B2A61|nr:hypothetical protein [Nocardiopsis valliformis]
MLGRNIAGTIAAAVRPVIQQKVAWKAVSGCAFPASREDSSRARAAVPMAAPSR